MTRPLAVLTGASSGIGRELAPLIAADGYDLLLVARRKAELTSLAEELTGKYQIDAEPCVADLGKPRGVDNVVKAVGDRNVEVLVNNAGFGLHGRFADIDAAGLQGMIDVNVTAVSALTRALLPGMIEHKRGRVLNVASTAAFQPGPFMAGYYASKAFVLSLSEALAEELKGTGVTVTALCPGHTATGFQSTADLPDSTPLFRMPSPDATAVARAAWSGTKRGKRIVIPGFMNKVGVQSLRFSPRRMVTSVIRRLQPV